MADLPVDSGSEAWVLVSAGMVFLMLPALAMFYSGMVGSSSVVHTMMLSFMALAVGSIVWSLIGYSLAFGPPGVTNVLGNLQFGAFDSSDRLRENTSISEHAFFVFQMAFNGITLAVISGGVVQRITLPAFAVFSVVWTILVYCPLAHAIFYDGGWLAKWGVLDFAGGLVVETASGVSAFVLAFWIGPGQTMHGGGHHHHKPHNVPFTLLGAGLLWIGWFFFNSGSALAAGYTAGRSFANTHLCASAAMVTWSLAEVVWGGEGWFAGRPSAIGAATGAVVGLVAITPACGYVSQMSSLLIGFIAAPTSYWAIRLLKHSGVDDRLECLPAHGVAGALGTLLTGLFASANEGARNSSGEPVNGAFFGNGALLGKQLAALLITIVICVVNTSVCFWIVWGVSKLTGGRLPLRVQQELQDRVDAAEHGEHAYHYTGLSRGASAYGVLGDAPPSPLSHGAHVHHRSLSAVKVGAGGSAAGQALLPPPSAAPAPALPSPAAAVAAAMDSLAASILVDAGLASPATQPLPVDGARHYRRPTGEAADDMAVQLMQVPPALAGSPARSTLQ